MNRNKAEKVIDLSDLEYFTYAKFRKRGCCTISIYRDGVIRFNVEFLRRNEKLLRNSQYVSLGFSRKHKIITFKFLGRAIPNRTYKLFTIPKVESKIKATIFLKYFGIDPQKYSGRYKPEYIEVGNDKDVLAINLKCKVNPLIVN